MGEIAMAESADVRLNRHYHAASLGPPAPPISDPLTYDGPERACQEAA